MSHRSVAAAAAIAAWALRTVPNGYKAGVPQPLLVLSPGLLREPERQGFGPRLGLGLRVGLLLLGPLLEAATLRRQRARAAAGPGRPRGHPRLPGNELGAAGHVPDDGGLGLLEQRRRHACRRVHPGAECLE
eukprot:CAMPEP_0114502836 /NCGR_PEP_ID=MMETSP0109-20121206/9321_1 /TAXON_ID=29199 /ORGANISM="Chlorarachnion reptans, Strain CCCM449" /LENGTH=131 /DNA_ID=CAMNT_0001680813 /DNA_START=712 /DNA_END=1104 /DNA_ORIENTATION=+